ncbi:MAG: hypothetical protein LBV74_15585 [Tannerella sp.]|nr:hypothetical protein [Tannerella sp.]
MRNLKLILLVIFIGIYFSGCDMNETEALEGTEWTYSVNDERTSILESLEFGSSTFMYHSVSSTKNDDELTELSTSVYTGSYFIDNHYVVLTYDDPFKTNTVSARILESGEIIVFNSKEFTRLQ